MDCVQGIVAEEPGEVCEVAAGVEDPDGERRSEVVSSPDSDMTETEVPWIIPIPRQRVW